MKNGLLLCKLVIASLPNSIDPRAINMEDDLSTNYSKQIDNLSLMVNAARCKGANMGNVDINELNIGNKFAILNCVWQIIRIGFFNQVNIYHHPEIIHLKRFHESIEDLKELSVSDIVLRYVNFHLANNDFRYFMNDFDDDFKNCLLYAHLLYRVCPVNLRMKMTDPLTISEEKCVEARARDIVSNLKVLNAESFVTEDDLLNGNKRRDSSYKLHLSTMIYLFIYYNGDLSIHVPTHRTKGYGTAGELLDEVVCKSFLNSFDVYPFTNHLVSDCRNGWILSEMFEILKPGVTSEMRFTLDFDIDRLHDQRLQNNRKIVKLCQLLSLDVCNVEAEPLTKSDKPTLISIILEMMRYYFCRDNISQRFIIESINCLIKKRNSKAFIYTLTDKAVIEENMLAAVIGNKAPGLINEDCLNNDKLQNCRYLISIAHKAGIPIYTLPEHFMDGNAPFISIAFATLLYY